MRANPTIAIGRIRFITQRIQEIDDKFDRMNHIPMAEQTKMHNEKAALRKELSDIEKNKRRTM